jgi:hypothetical protein
VPQGTIRRDDDDDETVQDNQRRALPAFYINIYRPATVSVSYEDPTASLLLLCKMETDEMKSKAV